MPDSTTSIWPMTRAWMLLRVAAWIFVIGIAWTAITLHSQERGQGGNNNGVIEGIVLDAVSGRPIGNAAVAAYPRVQLAVQRVFRVSTNADGTFRIAALPPGRFELATSEVTSTSLIRTPEASATANITIGAGETVRNVRLRRPPGPAGVIAGRISASNGLPLSSVAVTLFRKEYDADGLPLLGNVLRTTTDDRGDYRLIDVPSGEYYLAGWPGQNQQESISTYYPGTTVFAQALPLKIAGRQELAGINLSLGAKGGLYSVRFSVRQDGQPVDDAFIRIRENGVIRAPAVELKTQKHGHGEYEVAGLPSGAYLLFLPNWRGLPFEVRSKDLNLGVLEAQRVSVAGTVRDGEGRPKSIRRVQFLPVPADNGIAISAPVSATGTFDATLTLGRYKIRTELPTGAYIDALTSDGTDILGPGVAILTGSKQTLAMVLDQHPGRVQGVVRDAGGNIVTDAAVALVPAPPSLRTNTDSYYFQKADQRGEFDLEYIRPGEYLAFAFENAPENAVKNPQWLREFETRASRVQVRRDTTTAGLTLRRIATESQ